MAIVNNSENSNKIKMIPGNKLKNHNVKKEKEISYDFFPKVLVEKEDNITPAAKEDPKQLTFQQAMKACVLVGQFFGLNPVLGVCEKDTSKLRFKLLTIRSIYALISIVGQVSMALGCLLKIAKDSNTSLGLSSTLVFYGTNSMSTILFFRIATKWPKLCQQITKIEETDPLVDPDIVKRCNISCIIVLSLAILEHTLSDLTGILLAMECQPDTTLFKAFAIQCFSWAWTFFDYSHFLGALAVIFNMQCTFNWNFADLFVICISWYLTSRLKQVNDRIVAVRGKYVDSSFWRKMREDYCNATNLVRKVDDVISSVIFISFANNLYFICLQFLHVLEEGVKPMSGCGQPLSSRPLKGFEQPIYFLYSFGFLLARYISVSLIAARVHTASKLPVQSLYDVPSACFSMEVQRFIDQVHGDTVALSGLQFFHVKRGLLLTVAGTIVTYELVLMQFAGVSPTTSPPLASLLLLPPSEIEQNTALVPSPSYISETTTV